MHDLTATVRTGLNEAHRFIAMDWVNRQVTELLGMTPFPGTLNLQLDAAGLRAWRAFMAETPGGRISPAPGYCSAATCPVLVEGRVPGLIVLPEVDPYPEDKIEVVSGYRLRALLGLEDGARVRLSPYRARQGAAGYAGVLFDLEGTLVDFQWKLEEAEAELRRALQGLGFEPGPLAGLDYGLLRRHAYLSGRSHESARREIDAALDPIYDAYDADALSRWTLRDGARELLGLLGSRNIPCALVSNIGRTAAQGLLDKFDLTALFHTVVTRSDVTMFKPDGEGILRALDALGVDGAEALMVGDSRTDLLAARDAGIPVALITGGESVLRPLGGDRPDLSVATLAELAGLICWTLRPA